jgi:hypothetical protein
MIYIDPPLISSHTLGNSKLTYINFENTKKENSVQLNSIVNDLCLVLITEWGHVEIQDWASVPELQDQGWAGFHEQREAVFSWLPAVLQTLGGSLIYCSAQRKYESPRKQ